MPERPIPSAWYTGRRAFSRRRPNRLSRPLVAVICVLGFLAVAAWVGWRFGPTLARVTGWCSCWVAWACGSQGGYGCCVAFLLLSALAWGGGTVWYARRRGRWPSPLSAKLFTRLL